MHELTAGCSGGVPSAKVSLCRLSRSSVGPSSVVESEWMAVGRSAGAEQDRRESGNMASAKRRRPKKATAHNIHMALSMLLLLVGAAAMAPQVLLPGVQPEQQATAQAQAAPVADGSDCVSISPGASDFWCQQSCGPATGNCPPTMCACGPDAPASNYRPPSQQESYHASDANKNREAMAGATDAPGAVPAAGAAAGATATQQQATDAAVNAMGDPTVAHTGDPRSPAEWNGDNRNWGGDASCVSIATGVGDYWCATTCTIPSACPPSKCKCGVEVAAEKAKEAKRLAGKACDFDATGCITKGALKDCRACAMHVTTCMSTPHVDEDDKPMTPFNYEQCLDEVSQTAPDGCSLCNTTESKESYKIRQGIP